MNFAAFGIAITSKRDIGSLVEYSFGLPQGSEDQVLSALLSNMPDGSELSVLDPSSGDCTLEAKRKDAGYEVKRGCHGAYGVWRSVTLAEAHAWMLPGAIASVRLARPGFGVTLAVPKVSN